MPYKKALTILSIFLLLISAAIADEQHLDPEQFEAAPAPVSLCGPTLTATTYIEIVSGEKTLRIPC